MDKSIISLQMFAKDLHLWDLKRGPVMKGLRQAARIVRQDARSRMGRKSVSQPGQIPGMVTGAMRKAVKVHAAKKKDKFWARVQIDTLKNSKFWYPAPLFFGRRKKPGVGRLEPRRNPIDAAYDSCEAKVADAIERGLVEGIRA